MYFRNNGLPKTWLDQCVKSPKKSLLGICNISKLFPNTLSADGKYSLLTETI